MMLSWILEIGWQDAAISLLIGLFAGLDPFGLIFSFAFGAGDGAQDRFGQHRRHQCAAHRPTGWRRR